MKKKLKYWWKMFYRRHLRSKRKHKIKVQVKYLFKQYFEGEYDYSGYEDYGNYIIEPVCKSGITLNQLMITAVKFRFKRDQTILTIVLGKPGLLIGMRGETIDELTAYINERQTIPVKIRIEESIIW